MPSAAETNVRLAPCAIEALTVIAGRRRISRDEAVRQLLAEHVELQEQRDAPDRLTHISTVLRYPAPPAWRGQPRADRPLRLRVPPTVLERARAMSLRLPGQSQRAHRDYQSRLLTDAMTTAIAVDEPFTDTFLDGLVPLLRHGSALSLWKLATAATCVGREKEILIAAEELRSEVGGPSTPLNKQETVERTHLLLVAEALEQEIAWHSPDRFRVVTNIARDLLSGAAAAANEQMLHEAADAWNETYLDTLQADYARRALALRGVTRTDGAGRSGTAVWRAQRRVDLQDFEDWLIEDPKHAGTWRRMNPPGWPVRRPSTWLAAVPLAQDHEQAAVFTGWAASGRVLAFPYRDRTAFWPLTSSSTAGRLDPVLGIEPVIAAANELREQQITAFIEAVLIDWNDPDERDPAGQSQLAVPADTAYKLGLINAQQRRQAMAEARTATVQAMAKLIDRLPDHQRHRRAELEAARGNARDFTRLARALRLRFMITRASWPWPGRSIIEEARSDAPADYLRSLAETTYQYTALLLEQSMEQAWRAAFDAYGRRM